MASSGIRLTLNLEFAQAALSPDATSAPGAATIAT
jgi:hypothetical protein